MAIHHHQAPVVVVVVPLPAQSHLNRALQLSCLISSYQIPVYYAASATHSRQTKLRFNGENASKINKIHFHDLPMPPFLSPPPNPNSSVKFPVHLQPSFDATLNLRHPVATLLQEISLSARRLVVLHDSLMSYVVQDVAAIPNAKSYAFPCVSAFSILCMRCQRNGKPLQIPVEPERIPSLELCFSFEMLNFVAAQSNFVNLKHGDIFNTCRTMESTYLDVVANEEANRNKKQWAIAPINRVTTSGGKNSTSRNQCLVWLDKQPPKSVIYVSFGSTTSMTDEQIKELALGLKESKQRFLWVLRDADRGDIFTGEVRSAELSDGFEDSMKETGLVMRDWAPQLEILGHPSIGAFMSHCGWNSCMESLSMGVPIAAWPMHSDQPYNALLVTEILKVGLVVREWACQAELVTASTIKEAVEGLMASKEGVKMREKAEELGSVLRQSVEEGGVSRMEMDSFIAHITR